MSLEFSKQAYNVAVDRKRRIQRKVLIKQVLCPSIAVTPFAAALVTVAVIYFKLDPIPFFLHRYNITSLNSAGQHAHSSCKIVDLIILSFRFFCTSLFAYESSRLFTEVLLLTIFLYQMYEFVLKFLSGLRSPLVYFKYLKEMQLCHIAILEYMSTVYALLLFLGQLTIVTYLWLTIEAVNALPLLIYICCPCFALTMGGMIFIMIDLLGGVVHTWSVSLAQAWQNPEPRKLVMGRVGFSSHTVKRQATAQRNMFFSCGPFFTIKRATVLSYLNIVLANLSSVVLLIEF